MLRGQVVGDSLVLLLGLPLLATLATGRRAAALRALARSVLLAREVDCGHASGLAALEGHLQERTLKSMYLLSSSWAVSVARRVMKWDGGGRVTSLENRGL